MSVFSLTSDADLFESFIDKTLLLLFTFVYIERELKMDFFPLNTIESIGGL